MQTLRILNKDLETPYYPVFYGLKLSLKGFFWKDRPVPVAKEFDKYLQKNLIFKKVTDILLEFHKKFPLLVFGIYVHRCKSTLWEYLSVAAFNKPSYLWETNSAYTVILGCKVRINVLMLTFFFIAFINQGRGSISQ